MIIINTEEIAKQKTIDDIGEFEFKKKETITQVRQNAQDIIDGLMEDYTSYEKETFGIQSDEYSKYAIDPTADTPNVDVMAQTRGITREELMVKIGQKSAFVFATLGYQQGTVDSIIATTTIEELDLLIASL